MTAPKLSQAVARALDILATTPDDAFVMISNTTRPAGPRRSALIYWQAADRLVDIGFAARTEDGRGLTLTEAGAAHHARGNE